MVVVIRAVTTRRVADDSYLAAIFDETNFL